MRRRTSPAPDRRRGPARATAALVVAVLFLGVCGGDDDTAATTTSTSGASTTTTSTSPPTTPTTAADTTGAAGWSPVDTSGTAPPPRSGAVLAAMPDGVLWLHGGLVDDEPLGDLWRFDGERWEEIPTPSGPSPRSEHVAVWDDERSRLVIALGQGTGSEVFSDVWAFDPASGAWSQVATGGPEPRYGSCGVLDDAGRLVITHGFSTTVRFDDTWAFDLATDTWADVSPAEGPRPSARCLHACGYDADTGVLTLFGGRNDQTPYLGDTWQLDDTGWRALDVDGPSPRVRSRGLFTSAFQVLGGRGQDGFPGDAWTLADGAWQPGPAGAPAARQAPAVAQVGGTVWLVGGLGDAGPLDDLWTYG